MTYEYYVTREVTREITSTERVSVLAANPEDAREIASVGGGDLVDRQEGLPCDYYRILETEEVDKG